MKPPKKILLLVAAADDKAARLSESAYAAAFHRLGLNWIVKRSEAPSESELAAAAEVLKAKFEWGSERIEQFRQRAPAEPLDGLAQKFCCRWVRLNNPQGRRIDDHHGFRRNLE